MKRSRTRITAAAAALLPILILVSGCGEDPVGADSSTNLGRGLDFDTFQAAAVVIGQPDGQSLGAGRSATRLRLPFGDIAGTGPFYMTDWGNNRVLGFDHLPSSDGAAAVWVVGQKDFDSRESSVSASRFVPADCFVYGNKLLVADDVNNRVLIWNSLPRGDVPADVVLGQSNFATHTSATTQSGFNSPVRVAVSDGKLFVLDSGNNRCLIWNTIPGINNAPADVVVGQTDFTTVAVQTNQGHFYYTTQAMSVTGSRLIIGGNDGRVLIWNSIPTTNGALADVVVGAPDFDTQGTTRVTGVAFDGRNLYVAEPQENRVLIYRPLPTENGATPAAVLGQSDLAHTSLNDDNQDGATDATPSRRTMSDPRSVTIIGTRLVVCDHGNSRNLVYYAR